MTDQPETALCRDGRPCVPQATCENCARRKAKPRDEATVRLLQNRLNRMIGQLNGVKSMLDENRYCGDILNQIAAVENALQNFGYSILQDHLATCVTDELRKGNTEILDETVRLIKKLK